MSCVGVRARTCVRMKTCCNKVMEAACTRSTGKTGGHKQTGGQIRQTDRQIDRREESDMQSERERERERENSGLSWSWREKERKRTHACRHACRQAGNRQAETDRQTVVEGKLHESRQPTTGVAHQNHVLPYRCQLVHRAVSVLTHVCSQNLGAVSGIPVV